MCENPFWNRKFKVTSENSLLEPNISEHHRNLMISNAFWGCMRQQDKAAKLPKFIEETFLQVERSVKTGAEHLKGENCYENSFFSVWLF